MISVAAGVVPMNRPGIHRVGLVWALLCTALGTSAAPAPKSAIAGEMEFLAENQTAMSTMMDGMSIKPTGNIDRDFAFMMIPHHLGAIDMARAEIRHGKNEQLRRIAQEIIVNQIDEIAAMRLAIAEGSQRSAFKAVR
jgi:uncharacterized protein (DUF305 family)